MRETKTQGFVLKRIPYQNEKVRLFSVMTRDFGKVVLSGPEPKRLRSGMKVVSPLNVCEFEIYKSGNGHMKIKSAHLVHSLLNHKDDNLPTLQQLCVLAELVFAVLEDGEPNNRLYNLLINSAIVIKETGSDLIFESFKTKLLGLSGNLPNLKHCHSCKKKCANDEIWISEEALHLYCTNCMPKYDTHTYAQLSLDSLKLIHYISSGNFEDILRINANEKALLTLSYLNDLLLKQILNSELKSLKKPLVKVSLASLG